MIDILNREIIPKTFTSWTQFYKKARTIQLNHDGGGDDRFEVIMNENDGMIINTLRFTIKYLKNKAFEELITATDENIEFTPREMSTIVELIDRFHNQCGEPSELQKKAQRKLKYLYKTMLWEA